MRERSGAREERSDRRQAGRPLLRRPTHPARRAEPMADEIADLVGAGRNERREGQPRRPARAGPRAHGQAHLRQRLARLEADMPLIARRPAERVASRPDLAPKERSDPLLPRRRNRLRDTSASRRRSAEASRPDRRPVGLAPYDSDIGALRAFAPSRAVEPRRDGALHRGSHPTVQPVLKTFHQRLIAAGAARRSALSQSPKDYHHHRCNDRDGRTSGNAHSNEHSCSSVSALRADPPSPFKARSAPRRSPLARPGSAPAGTTPRAAASRASRR